MLAGHGIEAPIRTILMIMTKKRNNGQWTESRFHSFIKSALRTASVRWPPRYTTLSEAFVEIKINPESGRMAKHYKCAKCRKDFPSKNIEISHKETVVPLEGFKSWDDTIERLFCEKEGLEALCKDCHKEITKEENAARKEHKRSKAS